MFKNAYFLEKYVKNRLCPRTPVGLRRQGAPPSDPALLPLPTITTLSSSFLALNAVYYVQKKNKFCIFQIFSAIFYIKLCSFC